MKPEVLLEALHTAERLKDTVGSAIPRAAGVKASPSIAGARR